MWYYIYNNRWNIYSKFILFHCVYFLVASTHHLKEGRLTLYLRNVKKKNSLSWMIREEYYSATIWNKQN